MSKTRIDSWASSLTEEQGWTLYYKARVCQWQVAAQWAAKEFSLPRAPSRTGFYAWLSSMREREHEHRMREAAVAAAEAAALGRTATKDEALIAAFKSLATEAALRTDAKTAVSFVQSAMAIQDRLQKDADLDIKARAQKTKEADLALAREKFEAAEKRLNAAAKAVSDESLSDAERVTKIKELFGIK